MADDPWGPAPGYMPSDEFGRAMDQVYGRGKWRETGGWRSQAREDQLRAQGAQTVRPGGVSAHSLGDADAPGAHDIVVDGLTPAQAAARLKDAGLPVNQLLPEGEKGGQGAHLHVALSSGADPWGEATDPWAPAPAGPPAAKPPVHHGFWDEAGRLATSAAGGVAQGAAGIVRGAAGLADVLGRAQASVAAGTGLVVDPESGRIVETLTPAQRAQIAAEVQARAPIAAHRAGQIASGMDEWGAAVAPKDRSTAESIAHGVGGFVPGLAAMVANPALGAAVFGAQGFDTASQEARAAGATPQVAETAGLENAGVQGVLGLAPVGEGAQIVVRGVKGAIPGFAARTAVEAAGNAGLGAGMQTGANVVAETTYDPTRPWYAGVPESAAGMAAGGAALHIGGAALHGVGAVVANRLRPADRPTPAPLELPPDEAGPSPAPAAEPSGAPGGVESFPPLRAAPVEHGLPEAVAAKAYAQNAAHLAGAVTPDAIPVELAKPPAEFETARVAEGAPVEEMAPALADVAEYRSAAPKGQSLFGAIRALGGIRTRDPDGRPTDAADILDGLGRSGRLVNNKSGLSEDAMREALQQRGWFGAQEADPNRPPGERFGDNPNDLHALMEAEARGDKVYHPADVAPEMVARRAYLDREMMEAGVEPGDTVPVAAAKLAAMRSARSKQAGIAMDLLRARADAAGVPHDADTTPEDLHHDVVEREAIKDEGDGADYDTDERILDEHLSPEDHAWLSAPERSGRGEPGAAEAAGATGEGAAPLPEAAQGDRNAGRDATADPWGPAPVSGQDQLASEAVRLADGTVQQSLIPGTEQSAKQAAAAREGALKPKAAQEKPGGLFGEKEPDNGDLKFKRGDGSADGGATRIAPGIEGVAPDAEAQRTHAALIEAVDKAVARIAPHAETRPMSALREAGTGSRVEAAAWRDGRRHVIAWALDTADAIGAARHEAVHALRGAGLFKPKEWSALTGAAAEEGWMTRYDIRERYPDLGPEAQIEEAVAERFSDWRRDGQSFLPPFVRELFKRIDTALRQIGASVRKALGKDATAEDVLLAMERGDVGKRAVNPEAATDAVTAFQRPRPEPPEAKEARGFITRALGEGVDSLGHKIKRAADRAFPDPLKEALDSVRLGVSPMSIGSNRAKAAAKDFANTLRATSWEWNRIDADIEKRFTPDQRARMWTAADEESVIRQQGREPGRGEGLGRLAPVERAVVEELQRRANDAFARAKALGMTKADPLPSYVPRMVVDMTGGEAKRVSRAGPATSAKTGRNLSSTTGQLRHREHMTAQETEAAAQAKFGEGATVVRDIRTLAYATGKLEQAIAGRTLVSSIKRVGDSLGEPLVTDGAAPDTDAYFTIDHPAMKTWGPKFAIDHETGKPSPILGPDGKPVMEAKPLYIAKEFEGPLKAVLTTPTGPITNGLMALKGKMMSVIMFSPLMHNAVIWGKAIPAAPRQVLTLEVYRRGYQVKNDPGQMREALQAGLDPIGRHFGTTQDITGIATPPQIAPGRSWTAQLVGYVPGLFSKEAGTATKQAIDRLGNLWHNTFLWDRVGDLQMGLYQIVRDSEIKKGLDPSSAQRIAAHFANRYAGALPMEGMSKMARVIANVALFSRSFTLTNLGAYKDIVRGLPGEVQAQILRDSGAQALNRVQGEARRKAIAMLGLDIVLSWAGVRMAQAAIAWLSQQPYQDPSENEPGKQNRFLIRYQADGTAVYGRLPTGKVGEDMGNWATEPMETLKGKLSPFSRLAYEAATNDKGFGRKLYDPDDKTPLGLVRNVGRMVWAAADAMAPTGLMQGAHDLVTGTGKRDRITAATQVGLPMAGVTVSPGAPGGPAMADLFREQDRHAFQVQESLPAIMDQIRAGDVEGARARMALIGIPPGLAGYYVRIARNPGARLTPRKVQDFRMAATPEERARFERDRAAAQARAAP